MDRSLYVIHGPRDWQYLALNCCWLELKFIRAEIIPLWTNNDFLKLTKWSNIAKFRKFKTGVWINMDITRTYYLLNVEIN